MAYSEDLAAKVRSQLEKLPNVIEKKMMGGLTFMVDDKMCLGVLEDKLMCRVGPDAYEAALGEAGAGKMDFTGKPMVGFLFVSREGLKTTKQWNYWLGLCLNYNKIAPVKKKAKRKAR